MSNPRRFTAEATAPIVATEAPEWVRRMSDHYARTGTVRSADATRLVGVASDSSGVNLTASSGTPRNDDGDSE